MFAGAAGCVWAVCGLAGRRLSWGLGACSARRLAGLLALAGVAAAGSLGVLVLWWGTAFFYGRARPQRGVAVAVLINDNVGPCPVRHHDRDVARVSASTFVD